MVSFASNRPTDQPRKLFVVDEQGSQLAELDQYPTGALLFGLAGFGRPLLSITPASDGFAVTTYSVDGSVSHIVSVDASGRTVIEDMNPSEGT